MCKIKDKYLEYILCKYGYVKNVSRGRKNDANWGRLNCKVNILTTEFIRPIENTREAVNCRDLV